MTPLVTIETPLPHTIAHLAPLAAAVLDYPEAGYPRFFEKKLSA